MCKFNKKHVQEICIFIMSFLQLKKCFFLHRIIRITLIFKNYHLILFCIHNLSKVYCILIIWQSWVFFLLITDILNKNLCYFQIHITNLVSYKKETFIARTKEKIVHYVPWLNTSIKQPNVLTDRKYSKKTTTST